MRRMLRLKQILWIAACALPLLAAGCQQADGPILARSDPYQPQWLTVDSPALRDDTVIGDVHQYHDPSNLLHVIVPVRNTTNKQIYVQYRFHFYDRSGVELSSITNTATIPARGQVEIAGNATSPQVGGPMPFRLELGYPRVN